MTTDIGQHAELIATQLFGKPNAKLSNNKELRFGKKGSVSVSLSAGTFFDFENNEGGGMIKLIQRERPDIDIGDFLRSIGISDPSPTPRANNASESLKRAYTNGDMRRMSKDSELVSRYSSSFVVMRFPGKNIRPFTLIDGSWYATRPEKMTLLESDGDADMPAIIVEGEKTFEAADKMYKGKVYTWHGGTGSFDKPDWAQVAQEKSIIYPDNDESGLKVAIKIKKRLESLGKQAVIVCNPDTWDDKDDLADHTDFGDLLEYAQKHPYPTGAYYQTYGEFREREFPPIEWIVKDLCARGHLIMIHGKPGHFKSMASNILAMCMSAGYNFGEYEISKPQRVLLIDGEMSPVDLQNRMEKMLKMFSDENEEHRTELVKRVNDNFYIVSHHDQPNGLTPLNTAAGREWFLDLIAKIDPTVIIWDNLLSLFSFEDGNQAEEWLRDVNPLLLKMRGENRCVWFIHHSGKSGSQLGSISKTIILDCVLCTTLDSSDDEASFMGGDSTETKFTWKFEKSRHFYGNHTIPIKWKYSDGVLTREKSDIEMNIERAVSLDQEGNTQEQIAKKLGVSKRTVRRYIAEAKERGLYKEEPAVFT